MSDDQKIAILVPSRGRPDQFTQMMESLAETITFPVAVFLGLDSDDPELDAYIDLLPPSGIRLIAQPQPRGGLSEIFNRLALSAVAYGYDILGMGSDDIRFRTPKWDDYVREGFAKSRFRFIWGNDGYKNLGTHGFVTREWVETVGYYSPGVLGGGWVDVWFWHLSWLLDSGVRDDRFLIEHLHPVAGKGEHDETYANRPSVEAKRAAYREVFKSGQYGEALGKLEAAMEAEQGGK